MRTPTRPSLILITALLGLGLSACPKPASPDSRTGDTTQPDRPRTADGPGYEIRFEHPLFVGLRFRADIRGNLDQEARLNGKPMPSQTFRMTFVYQADATILALHKSGKPSKIRIQVSKLQTTKGGQTQDLLKAGTVVVGETQNEKETFSVNGQPVSKAVKDVLDVVVDLYDGDDIRTDQIFAPEGRKNPGDQWSPNGAMMIKSLERTLRGMAITPKASDVTGKVTFVGPKRVGGHEYLALKADVQIENIAPKMGPVKAKTGSLHFSIAGRVARDAKNYPTGSTRLSMRFRVEGAFQKGGKDFQLVMDILRAQSGTLTRLP